MKVGNFKIYFVADGQPEVHFRGSTEIILTLGGPQCKKVKNHWIGRSYELFAINCVFFQKCICIKILKDENGDHLFVVFRLIPSFDWIAEGIKILFYLPDTLE